MGRAGSASRAIWALLSVAESLPPTVMQTISSAAPADARANAAGRSPGLQPAVRGKGADGAVIISQKRAASMSTPVRYSVEPKVTMSGTTVTSWLAASSGDRSEAASVVMATRGMGFLRVWAVRPADTATGPLDDRRLRRARRPWPRRPPPRGWGGRGQH